VATLRYEIAELLSDGGDEAVGVGQGVGVGVMPTVSRRA
jgi:hypothetical protein